MIVALLQARTFNETPINAKKCCLILTKIMYLINQVTKFCLFLHVLRAVEIILLLICFFLFCHVLGFIANIMCSV